MLQFNRFFLAIIGWKCSVMNFLFLPTLDMAVFRRFFFQMYHIWFGVCKAHRIHFAKMKHTDVLVASFLLAIIIIINISIIPFRMPFIPGLWCAILLFFILSLKYARGDATSALFCFPHKAFGFKFCYRVALNGFLSSILLCISLNILLLLRKKRWINCVCSYACPYVCMRVCCRVFVIFVPKQKTYYKYSYTRAKQFVQ